MRTSAVVLGAAMSLIGATSASVRRDESIDHAAVQIEFPTPATTGVPDGVTLERWTGPLRTSASDAPVEVIDGQSCRVFDGYLFDFGTTGDFLYVDDPCVVFRDVQIRTTGLVSNTSAMVQQAAENERLEVTRSEFDGGPQHQRGIQADQGDLVVTDSSFVRFGNAAIEMNDSTATHSFTVTGNYLYESGGWNPDDHVDGVQLGGGGAVTIRWNTVLIEPYGDAGERNEDYVSNSALGLWAEVGDVAGPVIVEHNLLGGGGQVIYLQQKDSFRFTGPVVVRNNTIDRRFAPLGGIWGTLFPLGLPSSLTWTNNTYEDESSINLQMALNGLSADNTALRGGPP